MATAVVFRRSRGPSRAASKRGERRRGGHLWRGRRRGRPGADRGGRAVRRSSTRPTCGDDPRRDRDDPGTLPRRDRRAHRGSPPSGSACSNCSRCTRTTPGRQLLGIHAARLRGRPSPVRRRRSRGGRARRRSSPPPTSTTSRCGSTSSSTTPPRSTSSGPTYSHRGLADRDYYRSPTRLVRRDERLRQRHRHRLAGCPGPRHATPSTASPTSASTGSASISRRCSPPPPFVARSTSGRRGAACGWSPNHGTPSATIYSGRAWPGRGWLQWNDRFRDDVRGFLRAETGLVPALMQRVQGSPDLFDAPTAQPSTSSPATTGSRCTTSVAYDRKHNEANGQRNPTVPATTARGTAAGRATTASRRRSLPLRRRQLRNAWCLLAHVARRADGGDGRRVRPHPARQQQPLQPGQRDIVGRLGAARASSPTSSGSSADCSPCDTATRRCRSPSGGATTCAGSATRVRPTRRRLRARWRGASTVSTSSPTRGGSRWRSRSRRPVHGCASSIRRWRLPTTSSSLQLLPPWTAHTNVAARSVVILERSEAL